jgi:hypothetical protein
MAAHSLPTRLRIATSSNTACSAFVARTCPSPSGRSLHSSTSASKQVVSGTSPITGASLNPFDIRLRDPEVLRPARSARRPHRPDTPHFTLGGRGILNVPVYAAFWSSFGPAAHSPRRHGNLAVAYWRRARRSACTSAGHPASAPTGTARERDGSSIRRFVDASIDSCRDFTRGSQTASNHLRNRRAPQAASSSTDRQAGSGA